ncbi:hypothetical protein TRFO_25480 [Tritrichomonas foetus]|uniref:Uncharacterized protein n=1 Tax=Tritrichomonas foetus TaxID=1144522 RepID=A0A1J4K4T0_9EUKA|nr:hypothetical protein TRFO_25480 [Tritrichomonas foetus]|eukprot:OHT06457.1 hypothetical protein TRFO_25480 [Tritrichomonas foetus]
MKFVGSYVINRENVKFPDAIGKSYDSTTPDSVRCLRDRSLCRNKRLFAKILTTSVDTSLYLKMKITELDKNKVVIAENYINYTSEALKTDSIMKGLNKTIKEMVANHDDTKEKLKLAYEFMNLGEKIALKIKFSENTAVKYVDVEMNPQLSSLFGWDLEGSKVRINSTNLKGGYKTYIPQNTFLHSGLRSIIYIQHPDFISTNLNNELVTTICIKHENQLVYDQFFEVQSISPYLKLRFWIIDDKGQKRGSDESEQSSHEKTIRLEYEYCPFSSSGDYDSICDDMFTKKKVEEFIYEGDEHDRYQYWEMTPVAQWNPGTNNLSLCFDVYSVTHYYDNSKPDVRWRHFNRLIEIVDISPKTSFITGFEKGQRIEMSFKEAHDHCEKYKLKAELLSFESNKIFRPYYWQYITLHCSKVYNNGFCINQTEPINSPGLTGKFYRNDILGFLNNSCVSNQYLVSGYGTANTYTIAPSDFNMIRFSLYFDNGEPVELLSPMTIILNLNQIKD